MSCYTVLIEAVRAIDYVGFRETQNEDKFGLIIVCEINGFQLIQHDFAM